MVHGNSCLGNERALNSGAPEPRDLIPPPRGTCSSKHLATSASNLTSFKRDFFLNTVY